MNRRKYGLTVPRLFLFVLFVGMSAGAGRAYAAPVRPVIGLWYTAWWTADDQFHHWDQCQILPLRGRYSAGDPKVIARDFAMFHDLGVGFLIMDDTNGVGNDGGRINDNIRAWFDFMDRQPPADRVPICIGGGGEMRAGGRTAQQHAAEYYWFNWAQRPSYFRMDGKPLLLIDTDKNYGPGDFSDPRFTVRWVYNGDNHTAMLKRKTWGWGSYEPSPRLNESMSIWPGHRFPQYVAQQGRDPVEAPREGGLLYDRMWLSVLKTNPEFVTIADWNNFQEETAIEDSPAWEDPLGDAVTDYYRRITLAYSQLRTASLIAGVFYRDENGRTLFEYRDHHLQRLPTLPRWTPLILTPHGLLKQMEAALSRTRK